MCARRTTMDRRAAHEISSLSSRAEMKSAVRRSRRGHQPRLFDSSDSPMCVCVCTRTREQHKGEDEAGFLKSDPGLTTPEEGDAIGRGSLTPRERAARKGCLVQGKYTRARVA